MFLKTLTYEDKVSGWKLEKLSLDQFNLLVGASGVGKTRILRAIWEIQRTGLGWRSDHPIAFSINFDHAGKSYSWVFESGPSDVESLVPASATPANTPKTIILAEKLSSPDGVLIDRTKDSFRFKGVELPQLNRSETALKLLDEASIKLVSYSLGFFILNDFPVQHTFSVPGDLVESMMKLESADQLGHMSTAPPVVKAFILQERFTGSFEAIKALFMEIFPSVQELSIGRTFLAESTTAGAQFHQFTFKLKESGSDGWIEREDISSGMLRTLVHLVNLTLAPAGTVVLIDEFENSLGVNCMGPLTDFIQSRAHELQFIITSHHPYIINKIPQSQWKIVRRKGSTVRVTPASEIPALQGVSAQDGFTRLINSPEFEEGIS